MTVDVPHNPLSASPSEDLHGISCTGADLFSFAHSVSRGLNTLPKRLESRYLYDAEGSTLFEWICEQPEYYLTRTEAALLERYAGDIAHATGSTALIELGAGTGIKTQILLSQYCEQYQQACYIPIDISSSSLSKAEQQLSKVLPDVACIPIHATYEQGLALVPEQGPNILLFLGSTMGNLDDSELNDIWRLWANKLKTGDFLLLGVDINTDADSLLAAYNDAAGVTAAFTLNLFARMNRELGSKIDLNAIEHVASHNADKNRIEIHARFKQSQVIEIPVLGVSHEVRADERIETEISRRFSVPELRAKGLEFGFVTEQVYCDELDRFAILLMHKVEKCV